MPDPQPIQIVQPDPTAYLQKRQDKWLPPVGEEALWHWQKLFGFPSTWWDLARMCAVRFALPTTVVVSLYHLPWESWQLWGLLLVCVVLALFGGLTYYFREQLPKLFPIHWGLLGFGCAIAIKVLGELEL